MEQSYVKTSMKQRIIIFAIAFLLLAATIASYVLIVLNDKNGSTASTTSSRTAEEQAQLDAYTSEYEAKGAEVTARGEELSVQYFDDFKSYRSRVRSYNAASANSNGLKTEDLKQGTGRVLTDGDTDYFAYYIGYCADETVFDSSFDDIVDVMEAISPSLSYDSISNPTSFGAKALILPVSAPDKLPLLS